MTGPVLVKLGGSLLLWRELPQILSHFIAGFNVPMAILVGGGKMVDCLREWHQTHQSTEESSHWRAIGAMDLTGDMLRDLNPCFQGWTDISPPWSSHSPNQSVWVVRPSRWLESVAISGSDNAMPRSWCTTSDSIALKLASDWKCSRLFLLKSCDRLDSDWENCSRTGLIDPTFPRLLSTLNPAPDIEWINLRRFATTITNP